MAAAMRWPSRARRALTGAAGCSLLALPLLAPTAGAGETFELGSGRVRANLVEVVPRTGGLTIPYSGGKATASYQGRRSEATATVGKPFLPIEPKAVTDILEGEGEAPSAPAGGRAVPADCGERAPGGGGGGDPSAPPTASPFTFSLSVNSDEENSEQGKREVFAASPKDSPVQGSMAEQQVFATDEPEAHAIATQGRLAFDIPGGPSEQTRVEMVGGRSEVVSGVEEGKARQATGTVTIERLSLLGGLVVMEDLRWEATQRTGDGAVNESGFSIGRATIAGQSMPVPDGGDGAAAFFAAVNGVLAPTGLVLDPPRVDNDDNDARVTAMSLRLSDSPIGRATVGPVVGAAQPVRDPLVDAILGFSCDPAVFVTVADVVLSGASGSGGVAFDFGGITATTDGTVFDNPFGDGFGEGFDGGFGDLPPIGGPFEATGPAPVPALGVAPAPGSSLPFDGPLTAPVRAAAPPRTAAALPSLAALSPPTAAPEVLGDTAAGVDQIAGPAFDQIQPTLGSSVSRADGDRGGAALAAGLIGLLAIAALVAADAFHIRRLAGGAA